MVANIQEFRTQCPKTAELRFTNQRISKFAFTIILAIVNLPSSMAADSTQTITLAQSDGLRLQVIFDSDSDEFPSGGRFEFRELSCGGNFFTTRGDGVIVLNQRDQYEQCAANCQILIDKDMRSYKEYCKGKVTAGGVFEHSSSTSVLHRLASPEDAARLERQSAEAIARPKREKNKDVLADLAKATKCEEAEQFVKQQPELERPHFAKKSCLDERRYKSLEHSQNPQEIYLGAVKFESDGERSRAKSLYELIMEKFPASTIALKAADRLAALVDVEAIGRSNASKEQAIRDASQAAERRQAEFERNRSAEKIDASQSCRSRISSCNNSCDPIRDGDQRYACRSGCESICTQ